MNNLSILYDLKDRDTVFSCLKNLFSGSSSDVSVTEIVPDEYAKLQWSDGLEPATVAAKLSQAVKGAVIEIDSTTGIDLNSRFFNDTQLW